MSDQKNSDKDQFSVSLARIPVFDKKMHVWGYELFSVRKAEDAASAYQDEGDVAVNLASSTYMGLQRIADRGKKIIVDFNERSILNNLPYALPPIMAAVKMAGHSERTGPVLDSLNALKSDGYLIIVKGIENSPDLESFLDLANILCLEVDEQNKDDVMPVIRRAQDFNTTLLADRVEDMGVLETYKNLGFELFSGNFFKSVETVSVREISPGEISRFRIFQIIEKEEPDFDKLAEIIQTDVTISFRLLSYLNSVAFGFPQKIKSIRQAITMLGWRNMKNWLRVVLLSDMARGKAASELVYLAAQRSKFLETVSLEHDYWDFDPESLLLLGMFSLLDAMLGISMEEIVQHLPLEEKLKAALCREPNNEYLPLIRLAECLEAAKWEDGQALIQQLSLDDAKVRAAFHASVNWANEFASLETDEKPGSS